MKRIVIISFAVIFTFGFTFKSDSYKSSEESCPFLNKIHSQIEKSESSCPYLNGKVSTRENNDSDINTCPFTGNKKDGKTVCPFLKEGNNQKTEDVIPSKHKKLKIS